uniref:Uncharacterized protein n=1 Tax=Rhabditophanes sp. KR3021 TaxID=114890 RepID=A0AC35TFU3_9BILA
MASMSGYCMYLMVCLYGIRITFEKKCKFQKKVWPIGMKTPKSRYQIETPLNNNRKITQPSYLKYDEDSGYNVTDITYEMKNIKKQNSANYEFARRVKDRQSREIEKCNAPVQRSCSRKRIDHEEHRLTFF